IRDALAPLLDAGFSLDEGDFDVRQSTDVVDELNDFFSLNPIQFATGSATILTESTPILDEVADTLLANPGLRLVVEGHTDNIGSPESNQVLSEQRAASVVAYLVAAGVDDARLAPVGKGQTEPKASNDTAEGRAENRRIEFQIAAS
ncbi:MAG: OmpA family protein, partial [Acidimicrobiales bacterium]|nr:OmpA family protein [Acidimicrobiales bacterium]